MEKLIFRHYVTDPSVDAHEHSWWNENAAVVAKVWEMSADVSWAVRSRYLTRARRFFTEFGKAHVLELGCGSGWVGQSIAGPSLTVTGTDFSESQIAMARERARRFGIAPYTNYKVVANGAWPATAAPPTGILVHAFLHHLNGREIDEFFARLIGSVAPGTQLWIYEPAYYAAPPAAPSSIEYEIIRKGWDITARASRLYAKLGLVDRETLTSINALSAEAEKNGWVLSPKEVVIEVDWFDSYLRERVHVRDSYWATAFGVGWAAETNLVRNTVLRRLLAWTFVRRLAEIDADVCKDEEMLRNVFVAPSYGFRVWECVV